MIANEDDIATPVMIATQKEMSEAGLPLEWRDYCAHLALRLNKCRNSTWFLPWKCQDERHTYEKCQYEDYVRRMKILEKMKEEENKKD
ncbi:8199_t:CDS:2 [Entrophospora sp. SA101]|nr:8692_t:CDS:2 [Entrophospora candida]CAH1763038.1 5760_t:CDS:2 [Entrophospora sp. SA101]CAG8628745.1 7342_t:CDS:2 [Entrophospora candida]CAJ0755677.1 21234_t:CDS:2 [Entrophospora sp. SA101]CAJ0767002.1 20626_t:CDS:2 [Entrophospora sp. SA101]